MWSDFINRHRRIRAESRQLREIPHSPVQLESLRPVTPPDLAAILVSPATHAEWSQTESYLNDVCQIGDRKNFGVNPGDRRALWYLVKGFGARSVLEIGTHVGASTFYLAAALKTLNGEGAPRLVTVDIGDVNDAVSGDWKKCGLANSPRDRIREIGCESLVTFVKNSSLQYLANCKDRFDLVFLDGENTAANVYQEVSLASTVLKNGLVLLHDYFPRNRPLWPTNFPRVGPYLALSRVRKENPQLKVLPLGELPWPTKLGTSKTTLALVTRS